LTRLIATSNNISTIQNISRCTKLKELYIGKNKIKDLDAALEELSQLEFLRNLDFYKNPCTKIYSYKYDIIWRLQLQILDNSPITEKDLDVSKAFYQRK